MMSRIEGMHPLGCKLAVGSQHAGRCGSRSHARGFGIVELMIAMALGAVILLAVSELFLSNSRSRAEIEKSGRQIENGRFVLQMLADEIGNAGFAGEIGGFAEKDGDASEGEEGEQDAAVASAAVAAVPSVCVGTGTGEPEEAITGALSTPVFGGAGDPGCLGNSSITPKSGSQYIALRRASSIACLPDACEQRREAYFVQPDFPEGVSVAPREKVETDLTVLTQSNTRAPIYPFVSRIYFVNNAGVLYRDELVKIGSGPVYQRAPLVEGVEQIVFEYGVGGTEEGAPDSFKSASDVAEDEWDSIVVVRVWVMARNLEPSPGYQDANTYRLGDGASAVAFQAEVGFESHKRQVYSTTVRVNNAMRGQ